jgi:2-oxoglutarate ferredoxin oxidoreductase subunit gamma
MLKEAIMHETILFSGFGGQGVMFVGQLLAYGGLEAGLHVTWIPSYGPEMRGGTAHCIVTLSDQPIGSASTPHPSCAVVFNRPSYDKYEPAVQPGGLLLVNSALVEARSTRDDLQALYLPATRLASELGEVRVTNLILLGALLAARPRLPLETIDQALEAHLPPHRRGLLALNLQALRLGAAQALQPIG